MTDFVNFLIRMSYTVEITAASLLFLQALPHKPHFRLRLSSALVFILLAGYCFSFVKPLSQVGNLFSLQLTIIAIVVSMYFVFEGTFSAILSAGIAGVATQHIAHHFSRMAAELPFIAHWNHKLEIACAVVLYIFVYFTLARRLRSKYYYRYTSLKIIILSLVIVLICTGLTRFLRMDGTMSTYMVIATSLYAVTCCTLALFLQFNLYYAIRKEQEHQWFLHLYDEKKRQFEFSKENAELLHFKYHDLKHKLAGLENSLPPSEIASMRELLAAYDSVYHTGNEVLDIILNEKILHNREQGIAITFMGDPQDLDFLDEMDIYAIFGNLVDNAIRAVKELPDNKQRLISITVEKKADLLYINVMNFCLKQVISGADGLPETSRSDEAGFHGYGLKSVRHIAHKYEGDLAIIQNNGIFTAQLYLLDGR